MCSDRKILRCQWNLLPPALEENGKVLPCKWRHQIPQNGSCFPTSLHGITLLILILRFHTPTNCGSKTHYANYWKTLRAKLCYIQRQSKARENSSFPWRLRSCTTLVCLWYSAVTLQMMWTNQTKPHMGRNSTLCLSHAKNGIYFRSAYTQPNCRHSWREGRWQFVRLSGHSSRKEVSDFPV